MFRDCLFRNAAGGTCSGGRQGLFPVCRLICYQSLYAKPFIGQRTFGWVACAAVNAKNRMGGYTGAQVFYVFVDASGAVSAKQEGDWFSTCSTGKLVPVTSDLQPIMPGQPAVATATASVDVADELGKLATLRDKGVITQAEFDAQKAKLLAK